MRRPRAALALVALAACVVESTHPLSPPNKAALDKALLGAWVSEERDGDRLKAQFEVKSGGVMTITLTGDAKEKQMVFEGHVTRLGALGLLNVRELEDGQASEWMFFRYVVTGDTLEVWELREEVVGRAIEKGALKGTRKTDQYSSTVRLTDTPEALTGFIKKQKPDELFKSFATFTRRAAREGP